MKSVVSISIFFFVPLLSACGNIQTVKSFSTPYQEPTQGPRSRIRVMSDGMVRGVPNSACVDWRLQGSGVMVVSTKGFANMNNRKLDMPPSPSQKLLAGSSFAASELHVPAGKPFVLDYLSDGMVGPQCNVRHSFVPTEGQSYEAVFWQDRTTCNVRVNSIKEASLPVPIELSPATFCRVSDNL